MFSRSGVQVLSFLTAVTVFTSAALAQDNASNFTKAGPGQSFNPDISVIVDMFYHSDDSDEGISHIMEEMSGFGHVHAGGEEHHHGVDEGFNLRHLELQLEASVDPYFKASAIAAVSEEGAELETAEMETTGLPYGLKVKGGKFFSDFGYINAQHSHQWDFTDQPLIYKLCLGDHGLNDKGLQLSWLAPTPFYLLAGAETFQGDNEVMYSYHGEEPLPSHSGPRLNVAWLKVSPDLPGSHALQAGLFASAGIHQEEHDGDGDGAADHWLDGDNSFWGADIVYKYNAPKSFGKGDVILQGEYMSRKKDLDMVGNDLNPLLVGNNRIDKQDGYYTQALYGFAERWRCGLRWDQVGLINSSELPDGTDESFDSSHRVGAMIDFSPTEFSRIRLQANSGTYEVPEGKEDVAEIYIQWMISLGAHAAHKF